MCDSCSALAALEVDVAMAELEQELIDLEVSTGWSVAGATRPLFDHEVTARVAFGTLDRLGRETAAEAAQHALEVRAIVLDALAIDLTGHLDDPAAVLVRLRALASATTGETLPGVKEAIAEATRRIEATLTAGRTAAVNEALAEAVRQGVAESALPAAGTLAPSEQEVSALRAMAAELAEQPLDRALVAAYRAASNVSRPGVEPYDVLEAAVTAAEGVGEAGTYDLARTAGTRSHNLGRATVAMNGPDVKSSYASELMDRATCRPCASVDGRTYATIQHALDDYPGGGGFIGCLGGGRCRGTLVIVWATEADPTNVDSVDLTPRGPAATAPTPGYMAPPRLEDLAHLSLDELEQDFATYGAAGHFDAQMVVAEAIDNHTAAAAMTPELERAAVDEGWWDGDVPGGVDVAHEEALHDAAAAHDFDQESGWAMDPMRGMIWVGEGSHRTPGTGRRSDMLRASFDEHVGRHVLDAEQETNGFLLRADRRGEFTAKYGSDTMILFTGRLDTAYRYASEELRRYWEQHPRLTYAEWLVDSGLEATDRERARARRARELRQEASMKAEEDPAKRAQRQADARKHRKFTEARHTGPVGGDT